LKNRSVFKYHLLLIVALLFFHYLNRSFYTGKLLSVDSFNGVLLDISFFIPYFTVYFVNFYWVCPKTLNKRKIIFFILAIFGLILLFSGFRYLLQEEIGFYLTGKHNYYPDRLTPLYYIFDNSYYASKPILFSTILFLYLRNKEDKEKMYRLEIDNQKMQIDVLLAQISPHFLFNTLNTIYEDVLDKAPKAANNIHKLSEMLHYLTHLMDREWVFLKEEISFIEAYIQLNKERFEDQMNFNYEFSGEIDDKKIVPLILIHFLENIFKHGLLSDKNNPAHFVISVNDTHLELFARNKILESSKFSDDGIGETNIKKRLDLLFPNQYYLDYNIDDTYMIELKLPLKQICYEDG